MLRALFTDDAEYKAYLAKLFAILIQVEREHLESRKDF